MNDYKIGKLYEEMELYLIKSMKRNLKQHIKEEDKTGFEFPQWQAEKLKELKRYQRQNSSIIGRYTKGLDKEISNHLQNELRQGAINAIKKHNQVLGTDLKQDTVMNQSFFKTNDRKVNALINSVNNDLNTANKSALRMVNDQYRQTIHKSAFFVDNGVMTEKQAVDMATKDFLSRGINCIEYKDGRRVNIASYSQMAVRTASLRAQLMGDGAFRKSIGRTLVIAIASNAACPKCSKWENKVMIDDVYSDGSKKDGNYPLLSEAMEEGFLHPNCRDGISTYYPETEDIDKSYEDGKDGSESDEAYQEDLNYINQKIKQYTRLTFGSLDEENINNYKRKKAEWEEQKKLLENKQFTKEEQQALNYYISPSSIVLNEKLRNYITLNSDENTIVSNIDRALGKTPNYRGNIVRVMQMDNPYVFINELKQNKKYSTNQYLSFSTKEGFNPKANIKIYIANSKQSKDLKQINTIGENEVLYQRNQKFQTLNIKEKDGIIYVLWEEL